MGEPGPGSKKRRIDDISTATASANEILAAIDAETSANEESLDSAAARRLILQVEKKYDKNREARIKYSDEPEKFLNTEIELNDAIQELHAVTAQPELFPTLVKHNLIFLITQLLAHENADIVAVTCSLLQELTDTNPVYENEDGSEVLVNAMLDGHIFQHMTQSLKRLNEEDRDEADAVNNLLTAVENILEENIPAYEAVVTDDLFGWLLTRATKRSKFDSNKLFASQLLSESLQNSESAREKLVDKVNGLDLLLRALAVYKKNDPETKDETEHMENLFDSLCSSLMHVSNRKVFLDGEGPQLMNLMLREKKQSRHGALKTLSHATAIPDGKDNCEKFIEIGGLRTLFPLFMRSPQKTKKKDTTPDEHEEHVISIIDALLFQCEDDSKNRVLQKFTEHEFEKVDRLVELFFRYKEKVERYEQILKRGLGAELDEEQLRIELLNNGLYSWQRIGIVLAEVCTKGTSDCMIRANKLFKMRLKSNVENVLNPYLTEWLPDFEESLEQKTRIQNLISSIKFQQTNLN
ncbi:unnamed protein product [Bursaphelenchus xylophilus]|uniref:Beta-catenin-like protein 1 n=1 Tax=Bursaphelenchus xylophilus TaxID=6326 RepID=A0A1I7S910_BURXY|nr:unnamed protein product [Bursaphelenchus xylophilus]CAG9086118.1 unnamed protein product [Bursaphelenchus xylophilus]